MKVRVLCILVCVALACGGGGATHRNGTYVEPKVYEDDFQAKQGGTYVNPKLEEHEELRQKCGGELIVNSGGTTITSPGYPSNYANRENCVWTVTAENVDDALQLQCDDFHLVKSRNCKKDRFVIMENGQEQDRFCGKGSKSYTSEGNTIMIKFITNNRRRASGFSCDIRSIDSINGDTGCKCGVANPSRIVGGVEVSPQNKYSWQVGIKSLSSSNYWCGGSIISPSYIMSAAHCFKNQNGVTSASSLLVGVADHNMYSTNDDVSGATRQVPVAQVIVHPQYSSSTNDYDIALLKLKEPLELSKYTQLGAVCLPQDDSSTYAGQTATASGWGTLSSGGQQPSKLQEVSLPILSTSCWGMSGITARMLCAGLKQGGKDTCQGDSGGPLTVQENSIYTQVGITSWGYGCADPNSPGVYARVSKFLSWIETNTAGDLQC